MAETGSRRIVILHSNGARANRAETFPVDGSRELKLGREPGNQIVYDAPGDDVVSRHHAAIKWDDPSALAFTIEDLGSSNGTFVNKKKLQGKSPLGYGDVVSLGAGGPAFTFTLDPPPEAQFAKTRMIDVPQPTPATTRVISAAEAPAKTANTEVPGAGATTRAAASRTTEVLSAPQKVGIGRETMLHEIGQAKKSSNRQWAAILAAVVVLAAAGGGYLFWKQRQDDKAHQTQLAAVADQAARAKLDAEAQANEAAANIRKQMGMSAEDIVREYGPATAELEVDWRLYDQLTGRPIFLKIIETDDGHKYPLFAQNADKSISPWFTLDDENRTNMAIENKIQGSAFVISEQGFMLTNKHMAASWRVPFFPNRDDVEKKGILVWETGIKRKPRDWKIIDLTESQYWGLLNWIPETGGLIYPPDSIRQIGPGRIPDPAKSDRRDFVGRNDAMTVKFAGTRTTINATLVRSSDENDAALIKIESPTNLRKTELSDKLPTSGERVVVLGFPVVADQSYARSITIENGIVKSKEEEVPMPYVTEGIVALVANNIASKDGVTMYSEYGNIFQLTINSTGAGNSGGPVFDSNGKVLGLFSYSITSGNARSTGVVPIQYGMELLKSQQ